MSGLLLSDALYNRMRGLIELGLPAISVFYVTIAGLWGLPATEAVAGTLAALVVLLSVFLRLARKNYTAPTDGELVLEQNATNEGQVISSLNGVTLEDMLAKGTVTLTVNQLGTTSQ